MATEEGVGDTTGQVRWAAQGAGRNVRALTTDGDALYVAFRERVIRVMPDGGAKEPRQAVMSLPQMAAKFDGYRFPARP